MKAGRVIVGRIAKGEDLLLGLTAACREAGVTMGRVEALGAVERARVGFYDQRARVYLWHEFNEPLEILALLGNVSLKEGEVFVHAHVTLSDSMGRAWGGHLDRGAPVFACEYMITPLAGEALEREYDAATGLALWGGAGK